LVDTRIISDGEHGFSFPSGHAMGSIVFYGLLALWTEKRWLRWALGATIFFIGLSRNYLGVHYPHDVLAGWILGMIYLGGWLASQRVVEQRFFKLPFSLQLLSALLIPGLIGSLHNALFDYPYALMISGAVTVLILTMIAERKKPVLTAAGSYAQKAASYVVGIALVFGTMSLLQMIFPEQAGLLQNCVIWSYGALLTAVITYISPRLFVLLKLMPTTK
jgi:hypothetical protein